MKEMIYEYGRKEQPEVLFDEIIDGFRCMALNLGSHPCAYIQIPKGHELYGKEYEEADMFADVHGGFTFASFEAKTSKYLPEGFWLGWDYAHGFDFSGYYLKDIKGSSLNNMKKWTTEEIFQECKEVVEQLLKNCKRRSDESEDYIFLGE